MKMTNEKIERVYSNSQIIDHDLYVLKEAQMLKNTALPGAMPDYEKVSHQHFFHTIDSDGKKQTHCTPVGGHFHKMTIHETKDGGIPQIECGPPVKLVNKRIRGQIKATEVLYEESDDHKHEVFYKRSDKVSLRSVSTEATKIIAFSAQRTAPVPGIHG